MLDKPDFPNEKVIACLQADYGLRIVHVAFLPLGNDLSTAVYRAVAEDETSYFCKLKRGAFDDTSVALPKLLSEAGIALLDCVQDQRDLLHFVSRLCSNA